MDKAKVGRITIYYNQIPVKGKSSILNKDIPIFQAKTHDTDEKF
jgi:hypothetical protein